MLHQQNKGKISENGGNPINGSVCLPSMYNTSPAQMDFSVTSASTSHGSVTDRGMERKRSRESNLCLMLDRS